MIESSSEGSNINQTETSTYASAESSPSLTQSSSSQSLRSNLSINPDETMKNKLGHSISISSLLGNKNLQTVSLDDPCVVISATSPKKLVDHGKSVASSTSTNALDKLFKQAELGSEFQSLPHTLIPGNAKQANEIEKNLLNDSLGQKTQGQTLHDFVKNTVTSLIENTVKTSIEEMTKEVREEKEKNMAAKLMPSLFPANTVSSSSPNPACSPFKFLVDGSKQEPNAPKSPNQQTKVVSTLSPNGSTIQDAVSVFNAEQLKHSSCVIDKLAHLNHREHEKEDPVLTTSKNSSEKAKEQVKLTTCAPQSMTVPESSQEFCRNLNLNLAAAAANMSSVPVVVHSGGQKASENQQFTSNASTSSIHNDLKMILENNKPESKEETRNREAPKPQREKSNRSKASKAEPTDSAENAMKLVSMMKQMAESKGKPGQIVHGDESGKYRYTKEFLQQIRSERAAFIDNINPEIFKAYCYCMSGKYWDPEKYFDIVQFSGDYERAVHQNQAAKQKKNAKEKKSKAARNAKTADSSKNVKENIMQSLGLNNKANDGKQADKVIMDMLKNNREVKPSDTAKQVNLMNMLGQKKPKNGNILGELFAQNAQTKHHPVILTAQELELSQINRPVNRLFTSLNQTPDLANKLKSPNSCGSNSCASECSSTGSDNAANNSQAYKQLIKNLNNHPLCTPSAVPSRSFENVLMKLQQKKHENNVQNAVNSAQNLAKDGTNLLKQLLHMNTENSDEKKQRQKKSQHTKQSKSNKQELITSVESTVTTTTTTTITQTQFPTVNPHEKPFQNLTSNPNQLESLLNKMKQPFKQPAQADTKQQVKTEKDHFNSLLNKITSHSQPVKQTKESECILKWFNGLNSSQNLSKPNFSVKTLSEIELMSGHFP